jgi:hypothetical protein
LANDHLEACGDCREFKRKIRLLQQGVRDIPSPVLADDCDRSTRQLCHREIASVPAGKAVTRHIPNGTRIPRPVYLALMVLVTLTLIVIFPVVGKWPFELQWSLREILSLALVFQNAVMLLLSPLLIRRYGPLSGLSRLEVENG